jgi:thiol:disulfide interchange protein DsbD
MDRLIHLYITLLFAGTAWGQPSPFGGTPLDTDINPQDVIIWTGSDAREEVDGSVTVGMRLTTKNDFTIYSSKLQIIPPSGWLLTKRENPPTTQIVDPIEGKMVDVYTNGDFILVFKGPDRWTQDSFNLSVKYVGCTQVICLFPHTQEIPIPFYKSEKISTSGPALQADRGLDNYSEKVSSQSNRSVDESWAAMLKQGELSFALLLGIVFLGGALSNLTPCVYPMIPITVRILAKQGHAPLLSSAVYAGGIVVAYTSLGIVAALSGGMFGSILASSAFNLIFAFIMVALGITMLGFGNFSALQTIGARLGGGKASLGNTFLMGTGAGLAAAPCTGPILAALLTYIAKNQASVAESTTLLFTYSFGFGLPYLFLGRAATSVSKINVSPSIQIAIKMFFAAVMFGLAFYYMRVPFYSTFVTLKSIWPTLALWCLPTGVLLVLLWSVVDGLKSRKWSQLFPVIILGIGSFSASQYLSNSSTQAAAGNSTKLIWFGSEKDGFAAAKTAQKPILIDFWAEWCEACKVMEATTFADPKVTEELAKNWVLIKLDLTEDNKENLSIQHKYDLMGLPTLMLLPSTANIEKGRKLGGFQSADKLADELNRFTKPTE